MMSRLSLFSVLAFAFTFSSGPQAWADLMLQPDSASTNLDSVRPVANVINQSGLSSPYTSLATDFSTYIASGPTHNGDDTNNLWIASSGNTVGNVDLGLGGSFTIQSMALWNDADSSNAIRNFSLRAADNAAFNSSVLLGNFTASATNGTNTAALPEVFNFAPTQASFVRIEITSNYNGPSSSFGEVAFRARAVPEPSSLALLGLTGFGFMARRLRKTA
jgi:hypothetical protein